MDAFVVGLTPEFKPMDKKTVDWAALGVHAAGLVRAPPRFDTMCVRSCIAHACVVCLCVVFVVCVYVVCVSVCVCCVCT